MNTKKLLAVINHPTFCGLFDLGKSGVQGIIICTNLLYYYKAYSLMEKLIINKSSDRYSLEKNEYVLDMVYKVWLGEASLRI